MKSIIENGGIKTPKLVVGEFTKNVKSLSDRKVLAIILFNQYLNAIDKANDLEDLIRLSSAIEIEVLTLKLQNPFYSGTAKDGFGVYDANTNERLIFVECDTNLEDE